MGIPLGGTPSGFHSQCEFARAGSSIQPPAGSEGSRVDGGCGDNEESSEEPSEDEGLDGEEGPDPAALSVPSPANSEGRRVDRGCDDNEEDGGLIARKVPTLHKDGKAQTL